LKRLTVVMISVLLALILSGCPGTGQDPAISTVSYDGNGYTGGFVPADGSYEEGVIVTVLDNTGSLVKGEETFSGWNTASNGTGTDYPAGSTFPMGSTDLTLYAKWLTYALRDPGPAGGKVFYDKTIYSNGWRYLEAAPVTTEWVSKEFGAFFSSIGASAQGTSIGDGKNNTIATVDWLNNNTDDTYSDVTEKTERAAFLCDSLFLQNGTITYSDWFLPSSDELVEIYNELYSHGVGGFAVNWYWSSSENSSASAKRIEFNNGGNSSDVNKNNGNYVRAVRAF